MTVHSETIAQLVGKLAFQVDTAGLQRFNKMLQQASQQMNKLGTDYQKLAQQMTKGLKLKIDVSDAEKAKAKLSHAMSREAKASKALSDQKRTTFQAELANQKLTFAGAKQQNNLVSQSVKDQQNAAVIAAKNFATQQLANGATKQQLASQNALVASQSKQARLEQIVAKTKAITQKADAQHLLTQSKAQQIQTVAARIAQQTQHQAVQHQARMASLAAAADAKQSAHNNAQTKFGWAQQKQAVWQANQQARAAKAASGGGITSMFHGGFGGIGMNIAEALGPVGMAVAALTAAVGIIGHTISERVEKRQESTADTQQYDNALAAASEDPVTRDKFNKAYVNDYQEYGMAINKDTARTYSNSVAGLGKMGYTPEAAMKVMKDRSALFRAGNLNATQQESLNYQMGQVLAKGYASGTDYKPIEDSLGPRLAGDVDIGAARKLGYKGKDKGAKAFMLQARTERRITPQSLDAGFAYAVSQNQEPLERHKNSIEARQARFENDKYLQTVDQQRDPALVGAINERIDAERKLTEAMGPVNKLFEELDKTLTNFDTGVINLTATFANLMSGKTADGSEAPNAMHKDDNPAPGSVGAALGPRLRPDKNQEELDSNAGWLDKVFHFLGAKPTSDAGDSVTSWKGFNPDNTIQMDAIQRMSDLYTNQQSPSFPSINTSSSSTSGTQINAPITVEGSNIHIELSGSATEEDRQKMMASVTEVVDKATATMALRMPEIADQTLRNAFGAARAQQADHK